MELTAMVCFLMGLRGDCRSSGKIDPVRPLNAKEKKSPLVKSLSMKTLQSGREYWGNGAVS